MPVFKKGILVKDTEDNTLFSVGDGKTNFHEDWVPATSKDLKRLGLVKEKNVVKYMQAVETFLNSYIEMAEGGDCGYWDPEEELEIIELRKATKPLQYLNKKDKM